MKFLTRISLLGLILLAPLTAQAAGGVVGTIGVSDPLVESGVNGAIPAGANVIGKVGIDQTAPGVTNAVQLADSAPYSGACSASCNGTTLLGPIDTTGYQSIQFQMTAAGSGSTINWQGSDDPVCATASNWVNGLGYLNTNMSAGAGTQSTNLNYAGGQGYITANVHCLRLVFNAYGSGTYTAEAVARSGPANIVATTGGVSVLPIPGNGTPVNSSATGTTGALAPAMAAISNKTNWVCHIEVTSGGTTTPALTAVTITGLLGGTMTIEYWPSFSTPLVRDFAPCLQGSGINTALTLNVPALGAGTSGVAATITGFYE